jgi:hypothetical protein
VITQIPHGIIGFYLEQIHQNSCSTNDRKKKRRRRRGVVMEEEEKVRKRHEKSRE